MAFTSPTAALRAVATCLAPMTRRPIHVGLMDSGLTLDCCCDGCDGPLIRVESLTTRPKPNRAGADGTVSLYRLSKNRCEDLILDLVVVYRACWTSFDGDGPEAVPVETATKQGTAFVDSWWKALGHLACCEASNQFVRFQSAQDDAPDGGCAGWTMRLEADLGLCSCGPTVGPTPVFGQHLTVEIVDSIASDD